MLSKPILSSVKDVLFTSPHECPLCFDSMRCNEVLLAWHLWSQQYIVPTP